MDGNSGLLRIQQELVSIQSLDRTANCVPNSHTAVTE